MAVAFYIPSVDEDEPAKPNSPHPQQVGGGQHQQASNQTTGSNVSQQVCAAEAVAEYQRQHLIAVFHEILVAYAREAALAQHSPNPKALQPTTEPCLLCKKLCYLFRRFY